MANKRRTRKLRRQNKQAIKHGASAKPKHNLISGRTGQVHHKKLKNKKSKTKLQKPSTEGWKIISQTNGYIKIKE